MVNAVTVHDEHQPVFQALAVPDLQVPASGGVDVHQARVEIRKRFHVVSGSQFALYEYEHLTVRGARQHAAGNERISCTTPRNGIYMACRRNKGEGA